MLIWLRHFEASMVFTLLIPAPQMPCAYLQLISTCTVTEKWRGNFQKNLLSHEHITLNLPKATKTILFINKIYLKQVSQQGKTKHSSTRDHNS